MKTLAVTVKNKRQEVLFTSLASELGIEIKEAEFFKPLTTRDVALGIGRKANEQELKEYLLRTSDGKAKPAAKMLRDLKSKITKKAPK